MVIFLNDRIPNRGSEIRRNILIFPTDRYAGPTLPNVRFEDDGVRELTRGQKIPYHLEMTAYREIFRQQDEIRNPIQIRQDCGFGFAYEASGWNPGIGCREQRKRAMLDSLKWNRMYGTRGMYTSQGGQNSQRVLRRNQPTMQRRDSQLGRTCAREKPQGESRVRRNSDGGLLPNNAAAPTSTGVQRTAAKRKYNEKLQKRVFSRPAAT